MKLVSIGYGKTSKRYNTGSVYKISHADIARRPLSDPIFTEDALQGGVPGLAGNPKSNGLPWLPTFLKFSCADKAPLLLCPGQLPPNDPLFIIDGVPYAPNNYSIIGATSGSALGDVGEVPSRLLMLAILIIL